jgi:hypothetical protein
MLGVLVACLLFTSSASAQTELVTYVSSTGNDNNPCTRSQPCRLIDTAVLRTVAGGEVNVLDASTHTQVFIGKAITINGNNLARIVPVNFPLLAPSGILISADPDETVVVRGLSITSSSSTESAIGYIRGLHVIVEDCTIGGRFVSGILAQLSTTGNLLVKNTSIQMQTPGNNDSGIKTGTTSPSVLLKTVLENVRITGRVFGLNVVNGQVLVKDSLFTDLAQKLHKK